MAKLLLVCHRDHQGNLDPRFFDSLSRKIIPDNIDPVPPAVLSAPGIDLGVINPNHSVLTHNAGHNTGACLGYLIDPNDAWSRPLGARPDGSYALVRSDDRVVELVSDAAASRTIWYSMTDELFLASTSQRAIILALKSYQPNPDAFAWMLSAGNLGPGLSWDRRIKCLEGNSNVVLDRHAWSLTENVSRIEFRARSAPDRVHREELTNALKEMFGKSRIDYSTWYLLLSGGLDSRCILLMLENKAGLRGVTWGLKSALEVEKSDAVIARALADHYGFEHVYYNTDIAAEHIDNVFARLLVAGEGRTDTISAYMDGCDIWRRFFAAGISGVIRGDVVFSPYRVYTEYDVRRVDGAMFMQDFSNLARLGSYFGENQYWPEHLHRRDQESLSTWRDRLTYEYRCPAIWAALNEIKSSYVEVMNPLLSRKVLESITTLPDHLRDGRSLYQGIISDMSPAIGFAEQNAIENTSAILSSPAVAGYLVEALDTAAARDLVSNELITLILNNIKVSSSGRKTGRGRVPGFIKNLIPDRIRMYRKRLTEAGNLDINRLALRAYLIVAMNEQLNRDAAETLMWIPASRPVRSMRSGR
jgi:hypothetical protein